MFLKVLLITALLVALSFIGLAIRILLKPKGKFPETHISKNKKMREMGIKCAQHNDVGCTEINRTGGCEGCDLSS